MTEEKNEKGICKICRKWALGCELNGDYRRDCKKNDHKHFEPKKQDY
ncbi:unnamed protein product [marine sediment metagenome]|uniref:Uncharacterized protein n=1 Tax=marine sediment metagenome TaxID=412755 RepID=X1GA44_9ZZZZ